MDYSIDNEIRRFKTFVSDMLPASWISYNDELPKPHENFESLQYTLIPDCSSFNIIDEDGRIQKADVDIRIGFDLHAHLTNLAIVLYQGDNKTKSQFHFTSKWGECLDTHLKSAKRFLCMTNI